MRPALGLSPYRVRCCAAEAGLRGWRLTRAGAFGECSCRRSGRLYCQLVDAGQDGPTDHQSGDRACQERVWVAEGVAIVWPRGRSEDVKTGLNVECFVDCPQTRVSIFREKRSGPQKRAFFGLS